VGTDPLGVAERRGVRRGALHAWSEGGASLLAARALRRGAEALHDAADAVAAVGAARAVRRAHPLTLDEALAFADSFEYAGIRIRPMQVRSELRSLLELLAREPPRAVVEVGTGRGGTLFLFAAVAQPDALLISIDAAQAEGVFGGRRAYKRRARLYRALGTPDQRVVFIPADSHQQQTRRMVEDELGGRPVDLLFIDGDHTRAGVEADFRQYSPLVREGGLVAVHDIAPGPVELVGGVPDFWPHIRDGDSLELVEDWAQGGCGIGVLRL
jgi:predicted O-methyltransferase YrrM